MASCKEKNCRMEIYYLRTKTGRDIPVNAASMNRAEIEAISKRNEEVMFDTSRHITHFANCPGAKMFRKVKK